MTRTCEKKSLDLTVKLLVSKKEKLVIDIDLKTQVPTKLQKQEVINAPENITIEAQSISTERKIE